ncbi:carotene biosynthesis protein [Aquiflexum sp.]|uniref:carotene biosynthesis protein n=1 Tax=Aquiflexum sp. TaxID=1872584 RepID=UPI0035939E8B
MKVSVIGILFIITLFGIGYLIPREDFTGQLTCFAIAFGLYVLLLREFGCNARWFLSGIFGAVILRLTFIVAVPELSDDFYRYVFDGQLLNNGFNPYLYIPQVAFEKTGIVSNAYWETLLTEMNSSSYFSVYPPLHQSIFWISAMTGENLLYNIVSIRLILIVFEVLNMFLIWKIIMAWGLPKNTLWLYAFNPLVIIEISGNLHFEGIVLTGLLLSIYAFGKKKYSTASLGWSFAVGLKLTPLMLGPLWLKAWSKNKLVFFLILSGFLIVLLLFPLIIDNGFAGFWKSLRLYQSNFEFNASIYYVLREVFSFYLGYNPIAYLGPIMNFAAFSGILVFVYCWKIEKAEDLAEGMVWIYLIFLLLQPVVHPWYLIPAFGISVLTKNRVVLIWTFLVFLSYSAYRSDEVKESYPIISFEYGLLYFYAGVKIIPMLLNKIEFLWKKSDFRDLFE